MRRAVSGGDQRVRPKWWQQYLSSVGWWFLALPPVQLSLWRLERTWRLLLAVGAGILITIVLICTVPIYGNLVLNVSLQQQLSALAPQDRNVETTMDLSPLSTLFVQDTLSVSDTYASQYLHQFARTDSWYFAVTNSYAPVAVNGQRLSIRQQPTLDTVTLQPYILDNQQALPHLQILSGHLLQATSPYQNPQIMVTPQLGLKPGDTITISYVGPNKEPKSVTMAVAGVWSPKNPNDPYWNGNSGLFEPASSCGHCSVMTPIFFDLDTFLTDFGMNPGTLPPVPFDGATLHYIAYTDPAQVTTANLADIQSGIQAFKTLLPTAVAATNLSVYTQLNSFLASFQQQLSIFTQPLYIVDALVVGLALLFVIAMASLLIEDQSGDIATLKSRGAGLMQLLLSYVLQGLVMALAAAYVGPFLAEGLSLGAVLLFLPGSGSALLHSLTSGNVAYILSPQLALQPALVGAFLGLATLACAVWVAARLDILAFRREVGRTTSTPFWKRLHLDLALILLSLVGYLELGEFGTLGVRQQLAGIGQASTASSSAPDLFQLAAPALLLFGGGLLVLRLFPLTTRAAAWVATRARGATSMLAFAQLARNGWQFSRLALLLTLAVALGVFALTFQSSIDTNALAQAKFLAGADQRLMLDTSAQSSNSLQKQFAALPGVRGISPVYRTVVMTTAGDQVGLLAVDPSTFGQVVYWRADYAAEPLGTLMSAMVEHQHGALAGDRQHPIWALVDTSFADQHALEPGVGFTLPLINGSSAVFYLQVGAVVNNIPTMGNASFTGDVSVSLQDYASALNAARAAGNYSPYDGPNEFWLRTDGRPLNDAKRAIALRDPSLLVTTTVDAHMLETRAVDDPLTSGMATLLLLGAGIAILLAMLGSIIHAQVVSKQRLAQFAVLRTLGGQQPELVRIVLGQQVLVYLFSLLCGTILGLILSTATLPFLQFSTTTVDTFQTHLPQYLLYFNPVSILLFDGGLVVIFMVALVIGVRVATRSGLGKALRIGDD